MRKGKIALTTALWMLLGCTSDNDVPSPAIGDTDIQLGAIGTCSTPITRSYYADTYNTALPAGKNIDVFIYGADGNFVTHPTVSQTTVWVYQTVGAPDANGISTLSLISPEKTPKFPLVSGSTETYQDYVKIFAVFPSNSDLTPTTASYPFTVESDQTEETNILKSDLMANTTQWSTQYAKSYCDENAINLSMLHQMAKIHVTFVADGDMTSENLPTNFTVTNVYKTVTITPSSGTVGSGTVGNGLADQGTITANTSQAFFLPPQTISTSTVFLTFDIPSPTGSIFHSITGCSFTPTTEMVFEANTAYEVTVKVNVDFATTTASITGWTLDILTFDDYIL